MTCESKPQYPTEYYTAVTMGNFLPPSWGWRWSWRTSSVPPKPCKGNIDHAEFSENTDKINDWPLPVTQLVFLLGSNSHGKTWPVCSLKSTKIMKVTAFVWNLRQLFLVKEEKVQEDLSESWCLEKHSVKVGKVREDLSKSWCLVKLILWGKENRRKKEVHLCLVKHVLVKV